MPVLNLYTSTIYFCLVYAVEEGKSAGRKFFRGGGNTNKAGINY